MSDWDRIDDLEARLHNLQKENARLAEAIQHITYTLFEAQPKPRSASVTYVAGYARAMDDMVRAIRAGLERVAPQPALPHPNTDTPVHGADVYGTDTPTTISAYYPPKELPTPRTPSHECNTYPCSGDTNG